MAHPRIFRIYYSTLFTFLCIVLFALLLITPGDAINQALSNDQLYNIFVIAGGFLLTLFLALVIYASRLYTNRTIIAGIPKSWIPVEKGDVRESVRKMIVESLSRSAIIAWNARPRVVDHTPRGAQEIQTQVTNVDSLQTTRTTVKQAGLFGRKRTTTEKDEQGVSIPPHPPVWGEIAHEGWSSPSSPDLPNLQYVTVILELPHLIEAKAVSLAPPDPTSSTTPPMPDLRAIELLQRPAAMGLRDYISHLTSLGILFPAAPVTNFLSTYESARFSPRPRTEPEFRELMRLFADILRGMTPLDPTILDSLDAIESDIDNDASSTTTSEGLGTPHSETHNRSRSRSHSLPSSSPSGGTGPSRRDSEGTIRTASRHRPKARVAAAATDAFSPGGGGVTNTPHPPGLAATTTTPKNKNKKKKKRERPPTGSGVAEGSPSSLVQSFAQTRRPYDVAASQASSLSSSGSHSLLRSSSSGGESVIKLSRTSVVEPEELPYTLRLDGLVD